MEISPPELDLETLNRPIFELHISVMMVQSSTRFEPVDHKELARLSLSRENFEGPSINLSESQEKYRLREELGNKLAAYARRRQVKALQSVVPHKSRHLHSRGSMHIKQRKQRATIDR